jgi:hypothetical protein
MDAEIAQSDKINRIFYALARTHLRHLIRHLTEYS